MKILVVDGQGGKLGRQLVERLIPACPEAEITAVGTNSTACEAMLKGGASRAATGENALIVACRRTDVIVGPVGIVIADALLGEISPSMAKAVAQSSAVRVLLPVNKCDNLIVGTGGFTVSELIDQAVETVKNIGTGC